MTDRLLRALVGALTSSLVLAPFAIAAPRSGCRVTGQITSRGGWTSIKAPAYPEGAASVAAYAVSPTDPKRLYVTNSRAVMTSDDGGCTFDTSLALSSAGFSYSGSNSRITDLAISESDPRVIALAIEEQASVPKAHVALSRDGGATWTQQDAGLELATGAPLEIRIAASDNDSIYLLIDSVRATQGDVTLENSRGLYATTTGGAWERRAVFGTVAAHPLVEDSNYPFITGFEVDPMSASELWFYGDDGLYRSTDGARTIEKISTVPRSRAVDVSHRRGGRPTIIAFDSQQPLAYISTDGATFSARPVPGIIQSADHSSDGAQLVLATVDGHVFHKLPGAIDPLDVSATDRRSIFDVELSGSGDDLTLYGRTASTIERRVPPRSPNVGWKPKPKPLPSVAPLDPGTFGSVAGAAAEPRLEPTEARYVLAPGERKTVDYSLLLPGTRSVDVFFDIDVSDSMGDEINGLTAAMTAIVDDLEASGIDAHFGVGEYRSYVGGPAYHRVRDIGPPNQSLLDAIASLRASGGGDETMLAALYQTATGVGQDDPGAFIAPDQQAHFRPGVLRVIVHATDEGFVTPRNSPTFDDAAGALRSVGALQVGLAFTDDTDPLSPTESDPASDLRAMAAATDAVAPRGGVDCNGDRDRVPELVAGAPLVCVIDPAHSSEAEVMAPAIIGLVEALPDRGDISFAFEDGGGVVSSVFPVAYPVIDLKAPQVLSFEVTFSCPVLGADRNNPVKLQASVRGVEIVDAQADVVCRKRQAAAVIAPIVPVVPVLNAPPPPGAPPLKEIPAPGTGPYSALQSNPQAQSHGNPQGVFSMQRQHEPQTALAVAVEKIAPQQEHAMSAIDRRRVYEPIPLVGGMVMAFAFSCVCFNQRRVRTVRADREQSW